MRDGGSPAGAGAWSGIAAGRNWLRLSSRTDWLRALLGGSLGFAIHAGVGDGNAGVFSMVVLLMPGFYGTEHFTRPQPGC